MLSDRTLAKELARTLVKQSSGGLTDHQVDAFLALYDQQVPDSIKSDPEELQHLLDESKHIARVIDDYDMPSISVSVQDFRFSPPSISAEVPCALQFRLLPHSSRQQITVLHSDSGQRVANSGLLRGGDCFNATICDPGAYTFTSEVYPFMSGTLTAAAASFVAAVAQDEDAAAAAKETMQEAAAAAGVLHKLQVAGRQSPAPGSTRSHADSPRLAAKAVLQHQQQQMYQRKSSPSSDLDTPVTPDTSGGAVLSTDTASEPQAAVHAAGAGAVFNRVSDPYDGLVQQPSERAVLELLSTTAAGQADVRAFSSTASTTNSHLPDLSRAGRWARRATAYDDEADTAPHTVSAWQPASELSGITAGRAAAVLQEVAATSHFSVLAGSSSANSSSSMGAAAAVAAAAAAATSAAPADAATCSVAGSCMCLAGNAAPEDMDIDDDSYVAAQQQQQQPGVRDLAMLGFAKGLEGLTFSAEPLPGQAAAAVAEPRSCSSHQWVVGAAGGFQHAPAAAIGKAEEAAGGVPSYAAEDGSDACDMQPDDGDDGCGWYERLRSNSDHSSASSSDDDEQEQLGLADDAQHRLSWRQSSEAAYLLGDDGGVQQPQHRRLPAWGRSINGSDDCEAPSPTSSSSSEGALGDVRLRSLHWRSAAASTAALQQRQQQRELEDADEVLLVEDIEEYGPYEPLASYDALSAPEAAAAHSTMTASLQSRLLSGAARVGTAEAAAQTLPPLRTRAGLLQQPPGSSWTLGSGASVTVGGGVRSTFSSTNHAPLAGSKHAGSGSSSRYAAAKEDRERAWVQRTSAAAAAVRPTYYERLTSSRTHVGLEASGQVVSSSSSTLLGPGRHVVGQPALQQQSSSSRTTGAGNSDDPVAQLEQLHRDKARRLRQHQLQQRGAAGSDGNESPPELSVRLAQKRQQQLAAAAAASLEAGNAAAAAGSAAAKACSKKKKGRSRTAAGHTSERVAADEASAASRAAAAAAERRRERDHLECALYNRGSRSGSSRGDSENEGSVSQPRPVGTSSEPAVAAIRTGAGGVKQVTKCKFKACKLTFSTELNKQRCHMSHLPSARNTITQTYKAEVLAFLQALPTAALAQLVRLPEPASLPRRAWPDKQQHSQPQQQNASKPGKAGSAALAAASIQRLQASLLSEAWLKARSRAVAAAADGDADFEAAGLQPELSQLARLCCGLAQGADDPDDNDNEQLPLLRPDSGPAADKYAAAAPAHQQDSKSCIAAAAALAAVHVASLHGACCSSCSSAQAARDAAALMSCSCGCHPASSAAAGQAAAGVLPGLATIIGLLEDASEGTWLCNPRLLQQQHPSGCSCSVCLGLISPAATTAAGPATGWSPEAVMTSITSGMDMLDVLGEWGVDDASLSYAVERRMVTAFHGAKEAEARRIMSQLLEDDAPSVAPASAKAVANSKGSSAADSASSSSQAQQHAAGNAAGVAAAGCAKASKKKDKRKAGKAAKLPASTAAKKVPAWKDVSSDSESGSSSDSEGRAAAGAASLPVLHAASAHGSLASRVGRGGKLAGGRGIVFADKPADSPRQQAAVFDSPGKGKQLAEQLLQARLLQQDQELSQLRQQQQQQQQGVKRQEEVQRNQQPKQPAQQQRTVKPQAATVQVQAKQQPAVKQARKQQVQQHAGEQRKPATNQAQPAGNARKPTAATSATVKLAARQARGATASAVHGSKGAATAADSRSTSDTNRAQQQLQRPAPQHPAQQQQQPVLQPSSVPAATISFPEQWASSTSVGGNSSGTGLMLPAAASALVVQQQQQLVVASVVEQAVVGTAELAAPAARSASAEVPVPSPGIAEVPVPSPGRAGVQAGAAPTGAHLNSRSIADAALSDQQVYAQSSGSSLISPSPAPGQPAASLPAPWPVDPCESSQVQQPLVSFQQEQLDDAASIVAAGGDSFSEPPQDMQEQQLLAWQQHYQQHQQHALLMYRTWLAAAQQSALNDMLVWSGRAAAVATGQQPLPFTAQEQQYLEQWTHFYYYQQAYTGMASAAQQQQQQQHHCVQLGLQDVQAAGMQQPGPSSMPRGRSTTPGSGAGSDGDESEQQQQQQQQQEGAIAVQLQFGSFPAEFAFSPGRDSTRGRGSPCATPSPGPAAVAAGADAAAAATTHQQVAITADAGASSASADAPAAVDSSQMRFQHQEQQQHSLAAYSSEQYMYWWTYQQHCAAHLQQQQISHSAAASAQEDEISAAVELPQSPVVEGGGLASAGSDALQQAKHTQQQHLQQPCTKFLADMAAAVGQALAAEQAAGRASSIRNAGDGESRFVEACFNAGVAADLLDSRWETITQAYGLPARQAMLPAQPTTSGPSCLACKQQQQPAGSVSAVEAADDDAGGHMVLHARQRHGRGHGAHAQQQPGQRSKPGTSSRKSGSSSSWRVRRKQEAGGVRQ